MIYSNMTNIKQDMILSSCFNYHIISWFPAAQIRFLAKSDLQTAAGLF
uniref:Uncharacterized protein n=1 Tax=Leclercia adecarboxylata TaxID=83655 RepID=A0A482LY54_9ENTR|nr:Hypothetical protein [Leclercia adecarboxylata]QLG00564.1 hypothetical protein [Leclercia adecarboxylata]